MVIESVHLSICIQLHMTKHPSRKVMNFRHLLGCDTKGPTCWPGVSSIQTEDPKQALVTLKESRRECLLSLFIFQSSLASSLKVDEIN